MSTPFSDQELIIRIRWYVAVRWFFVLAIGVPGVASLAIHLGSFLNDRVMFNAIAIIAILLLNTVILACTNIRVGMRGFYELLSILQIAIDLLLMTIVFQFNGGIETPFVMLYCIPILMSGTLLSKNAIYGTGLAATVIFATLTLLDYTNIYKPDSIEAPQLHTNGSGFLPTYVTTIMTLIVITFIADFVAHFVRRSSRLEGELEGAKVEQAKTEAVIQSMGSSLVAVNNRGKIILVNHAFERLMGWSASDVAGKEMTDILQVVKDNGKSSDDLKQAFRVVHGQKHASEQGPYFVGDNFLKRKNGGTFAYTGHLSPIIADGRNVGATFVFDDASAIREVGQLKSNFIALASHQLKTPIGEIKNYSESLLGGTVGKLNKKQQNYITHVHDIATRANQMVTYLLDMSLLERGELRAKLEAIDVYQLLEETAELYKGRVKRKGMKLRVTGDKGLIVQGDAMMLQEVVGSLIANGINYAESGMIELCATKVGSVGCIEVTDQGKGIEKEQLQHIFSKESVMSGLPEPGGGTGLGLYLAHEFVRLQGGVLMVDRNDERGTIFRIELPVK
jgi:PAS domain S-box-containing protein